MVANKEMMADEQHGGEFYGVKVKDVMDILYDEKICVMDFQKDAFLMMKLRAAICVRGVAVTYNNLAEAELNLKKRQKSLNESDAEVNARLALIQEDENFVNAKRDSFDELINFQKTERPDKFWKSTITNVI